MASKVEVSVEYWELAEQIKAEVPETNVVGHVGRFTSFEVTINGKLVYSKLSQ
ncbi:unnamed protein product [Porites evermanni]|uniref:Uncharacterized protein n=1 Tax=Porites evermanni TaxID=104178 RepID=A0ABN8MDA8_9CNID|nr:unnamed protein product [Porites evermanni]